MRKALAPIALLRTMLVVLALAYPAAICLDLYPPLSTEASSYRQLAVETLSGLCFECGLQKMFWTAGTGAGLLGTILLFFRRPSGLVLFALSAPLLVVAVLLVPFYPAYPDIMETYEIVLWCVSSGLWGASLVYVLFQRSALFMGRDARPALVTVLVMAICVGSYFLFPWFP